MSDINYYLLNNNNSWYWCCCTVLGLLLFNGLWFAHLMDQQGHWITGMSNQVVWGVPHVFAIFLILTASGVLNVATVSSVFGKPEYQSWARLSGLLGISMLLGGLLILVLDLGRPDRLIIAITHYNFASIFAWNIFLYSGFVLLVVVYLWMLFEPKMNRYSTKIGAFTFVWRLILTTGTGSIFGILIARNAYDSLLMVPLFISMSLSFGTALFILVLAVLYPKSGSDDLALFVSRLRRLLGKFIIAVFLCTILFHVVKILNNGLQGYESFILAQTNVYTLLFWGGQIALGTVIPLYLLFSKKGSLNWQVLASSLVIVGAFSQLYVIIVGGQVYPLEIFPGKDVSSRFFDGVISHYYPSLPEIALGLGGIALSFLVCFLMMRILPFLPLNTSISRFTRKPGC